MSGVERHGPQEDESNLLASSSFAIFAHQIMKSCGSTTFFFTDRNEDFNAKGPSEWRKIGRRNNTALFKF